MGKAAIEALLKADSSVLQVQANVAAAVDLVTNSVGFLVRTFAKSDDD
jgi:hypothetical protein